MAEINFPAFTATSCGIIDPCPQKLEIKTHEISKIKEHNKNNKPSVFWDLTLGILARKNQSFVGRYYGHLHDTCIGNESSDYD